MTDAFLDGWLIGFVTGFSTFGVLYAVAVVAGVL